VPENPLSFDQQTLAAQLYQLHVATVTRRLARRYQGVDGQLIADAFVRAVLQVSRHWETFDPKDCSPQTYLTGAAKRVLSRLLRGEQRRQAREEKKRQLAVTETPAVARSFLERLADREQYEVARGALARTPEELQLLDLWLEGNDDLDTHAAILGLAGCSAEQLQKAMETLHARFRQRLHRYRKALREKEGEP
jgi:RNA polymerase sigma factor (sigma-70 family)